MISVIIATKNGQKYIERALDSVMNQKDVDFEVVLVSDGSTDDTPQIIRDYIENHPLACIRLIELTKNIGPGLARNLAILGDGLESESATDSGSHLHSQSQLYPECRGQYIALLDDDDIWIDEYKLKRQRDYLIKNEEVVIVGSATVDFVNENGEIIKKVSSPTSPIEARQLMLSRNPLITSSVMFRKEIFKKVGGFNKMYLAEDYDLWLRMGLLGSISNIEDAGIQYMVRKSSASHNKKFRISLNVLRLVLEHRKNYPGFFFAVIKAILRVLRSLV